MTPATQPRAPLGVPMPGIDEAWSRAAPSEIKAAGYEFVCRYYSYDTTGKNLSPTEAKSLADTGLWIVTVWEFTPGAPLNGRTQGSMDANTAVRQAQACGQRPGSTIYFACDENFDRTDYGTIGEYFHGVDGVVAANNYRTGAYAGYALGKWLLDNDLIDDLWQTYAWSSGLWDARAAIRQTNNGIVIGGANVDINSARTINFGQWQPGRLPTDKDAASMELTTTVPGSATPDHPTDRVVNDILKDLAQLRNMLIVGDVTPPAKTPLARLLALPDQVAATLSAMQSAAASLATLTAGVQALHNSQVTDDAVRAIAVAIGQVAAGLGPRAGLTLTAAAPGANAPALDV